MESAMDGKYFRVLYDLHAAQWIQSEQSWILDDNFREVKWLSYTRRDVQNFRWQLMDRSARKKHAG